MGSTSRCHTFRSTPFFIEFLKLGNLFDPFVEECPLQFTSPNAPSNRDILGILLLSVLAGHTVIAHITALSCDGVNPDLLGMKKIVSEDSMRRAFLKMEKILALRDYSDISIKVMHRCCKYLGYWMLIQQYKYYMENKKVRLLIIILRNQDVLLILSFLFYC